MNIVLKSKEKILENPKKEVKTPFLKYCWRTLGVAGVLVVVYFGGNYIIKNIKKNHKTENPQEEDPAKETLSHSPDNINQTLNPNIPKTKNSLQEKILNMDKFKSLFQEDLIIDKVIDKLGKDNLAIDKSLIDQLVDYLDINDQVEYYKNFNPEINEDFVNNFPLKKIKKFFQLLQVLDENIEKKKPITKISKFKDLIIQVFQNIRLLILFSKKSLKILPSLFCPMAKEIISIINKPIDSKEFSIANLKSILQNLLDDSSVKKSIFEILKRIKSNWGDDINKIQELFNEVFSHDENWENWSELYSYFPDSFMLKLMKDELFLEEIKKSIIFLNLSDNTVVIQKIDLLLNTQKRWKEIKPKIKEVIKKVKDEDFNEDISLKNIEKFLKKKKITINSLNFYNSYNSTKEHSLFDYAHDLLQHEMSALFKDDLNVVNLSSFAKDPKKFRGALSKYFLGN